MSDFVALRDKTNSLVTLLKSHEFKSHDLQNSVPTRLSSHSDGASYDEPFHLYKDDYARTVQELTEFKEAVSRIKFAYLESNTKLQVVGHLLSETGVVPISVDTNTALEQRRAQTKAQLQAKKARVRDLERRIRAVAARIDARQQTVVPQAARAAQRVKDIATAETELAMLRNKRAPLARMTIAETEAALDAQDETIAAIGPATKAAEAQIRDARHEIRARKLRLEALSAQLRDLARQESEYTSAKSGRNEKIEQECRRLISATSALQELLGTGPWHAVGEPVSEIRVELPGDRVLCLQTPDGYIAEGKLLNSSIDVAPIIAGVSRQADLCSQVQDVVQQVKLRLSV